MQGSQNSLLPTIDKVRLLPKAPSRDCLPVPDTSHNMQMNKSFEISANTDLSRINTDFEGRSPTRIPTQTFVPLEATPIATSSKRYNDLRSLMAFEKVLQINNEIQLSHIENETVPNNRYQMASYLFLKKLKRKAELTEMVFNHMMSQNKCAKYRLSKYCQKYNKDPNSGGPRPHSPNSNSKNFVINVIPTQADSIIGTICPNSSKADFPAALPGSNVSFTALVSYHRTNGKVPEVGSSSSIQSENTDQNKTSNTRAKHRGSTSQERHEAKKSMDAINSPLLLAPPTETKPRRCMTPKPQTPGKLNTSANSNEMDDKEPSPRSQGEQQTSNRQSKKQQPPQKPKFMQLSKKTLEIEDQYQDKGSRTSLAMKKLLRAKIECKDSPKEKEQQFGREGVFGLLPSREELDPKHVLFVKAQSKPQIERNMRQPRRKSSLLINPPMEKTCITTEKSSKFLMEKEADQKVEAHQEVLEKIKQEQELCRQTIYTSSPNLKPRIWLRMSNAKRPQRNPFFTQIPKTAETQADSPGVIHVNGARQFDRKMTTGMKNPTTPMEGIKRGKTQLKDLIRNLDMNETYGSRNIQKLLQSPLLTQQHQQQSRQNYIVFDEQGRPKFRVRVKQSQPEIKDDKKDLPGP